MRRLRRPVIFERYSAAAQAVREQVVQHAVPVHGDLLPVEAVVLDRRRCAVGDAGLGIAIEGDGVGGCGCAVRGIARGLQHAIARVVIEETIAGRCTARCRPRRQASCRVIGHGCAVGRTATTGMTRSTAGTLASQLG